MRRPKVQKSGKSHKYALGTFHRLESAKNITELSGSKNIKKIQIGGKQLKPCRLKKCLFVVKTEKDQGVD